MASYEQIDFHADRSKIKPVFNKFEIFDEVEIQTGSLQYKNIKLRQNKIMLYDGGWLKQETWTTYVGGFFELGRTISQRRQRSLREPNLLMQVILTLDDIGVVHTRQGYGIFDLCGDLGGVLGVIVVVFGVLMHPLSKYNYELKLFEKLYVVKTNDANLFRKADLGKKAFVA